jgi:NADH-quinone oxidoreductase subunit K
MLPVSLANYVLLSSVLFMIGAAGVILRRNPLIMLMGIELMLNASNLALIAFARAWGNSAGHVFAFLVITVAAAEAAIGLAIIVVTYRNNTHVDIDDVAVMKG